MFNETSASNLEGAVIIARRTLNVGHDCANLLQEMADRVRKEDRELTQEEFLDLARSFRGMLVFE